MAEVGIEIPATGPDAPQAPTNDRPAWLPENFKSPEDLVKSYQTLQSEYTRIKQGNAPAAEPKVGDALKPNDPSLDQRAAEAVAGAGLDFDRLADEFMAEGTLKPESYEALAKQGIPKHLVDDFIRLKQVEAQSVMGEMLEIAGGDESFEMMSQWASTGAFADVDAYNQMITSGDPAQMRMAMTALKTAYVNANGQDPRLVMGNGSATIGDVYANDLEMVADMQKPAYRTDPAFRRQVEEKVARTMANKR